MESRELFAMDTVMTLTAYGPGTSPALDAAEAEIQRLDRLLSVTQPSGEIYSLNAAGEAALSGEVSALLQRALEISRRTGGAFDVTLLPLSRAWGFLGPDTPHVPTEAEIGEALSRTGADQLTFTGDSLRFQQAGMGLDLGGIGKGYAAAQAADILRAQGVTSAILSLGGNVLALGTKPDGSLWRVAVQDPFDQNAYVGILDCADCAVVTSGDYQRYFEQDGQRYHHILDPETGFPAASGLASVTIVCPDPVLADGLSTALFVMGLEKAADFWRANRSEFQAILVTTAGEVYITQDIQDRFSAQGALQVIAP